MAYTIPSTGPISVGGTGGDGRSLNLLRNAIDNTTTANTNFSLSGASNWFSLNSSSSVLVPNMTAGAPYRFSEFRNASKNILYQELYWWASIDGSDYFAFLPNTNQLLVEHGAFEPVSFNGMSYKTYREDGTILNQGSFSFGYGYTSLPFQLLSATNAVLISSLGRYQTAITIYPSVGNNYVSQVIFNDSPYPSIGTYDARLLLSVT